MHPHYPYIIESTDSDLVGSNVCLLLPCS